MKSRMMPFLLVLFVVAGAWMSTRSVRVQESRGPRWEYCSVGTGSGADKNRAVSRVSYFSTSGVRRGDAVDGADPMDSFRRAMAKLGAEGWELVAVVGDVPVAYFKRPLP